MLAEDRQETRFCYSWHANNTRLRVVFVPPPSHFAPVMNGKMQDKLSTWNSCKEVGSWRGKLPGIWSVMMKMSHLRRRDRIQFALLSSLPPFSPWERGQKMWGHGMKAVCKPRRRPSLNIRFFFSWYLDLGPSRMQNRWKEMFELANSMVFC